MPQLSAALPLHTSVGLLSSPNLTSWRRRSLQQNRQSAHIQYLSSVVFKIDGTDAWPDVRKCNYDGHIVCTVFENATFKWHDCHFLKDFADISQLLEAVLFIPLLQGYDVV